MSGHVSRRDDRHFHNDFPSDIGDNKDRIMDSDKKKLSGEYLEQIEKNLKVLQKTLDEQVAKGDEEDDYSVYTGTSGYSLLYLRLAQRKEDTTYMKKASSILKSNLRHLKGRRPSFLCGDLGPLALAAVLHHREGDAERAEDCITRIKQMKKEMLNPTSGLPDEMLYGRAGFLYALLLLQKEVGRSAVEDSLVRGVIDAMLESGRTLARKRKSSAPLMYQWHDSDYLGAAHGTSGILYMLMQAKEFLTSQELEEVVKPTVDYLVSLVFPSGNFPSSLGSDRDRLVHWCHGAPGSVYLFAKAYQVFGNENYLEEAKRAGKCVWERGILRKGYSLCHGTAGNGYALLYLYQVTREPRYLYQAAQFGVWCQDYGIRGCHTADRPYSLFEGLAGMLCFLVDLEDPENARFPAFALE
ncbi:LanC-like protein 2 [Chionoecetes opilio]|uniref:LanC-like protein 2 n=1 Tax=Chionoecetes opilio TaxID=41210 RepID=A0A8J4XYA0_CHIOP|nr:LanC-like protein 2 [Chionoecetes opilio]